MKMGTRSQSFLREPDFIEIFSKNGELEKILEKKSNGNFKAKKSQLIKMLHVRGYDRQLIINATLIQNYKLDEMKSILKEFSEYLKYQCDLEGVLELHPQDTTQNSYHFHFWTNNDTEYAYEGMKEFILGKDLANHENVDIQGKYAKFTKGTYFDEDGNEIYDFQGNLKLKKEMMKANINVKKISDLKQKKPIQRIKHEFTSEQRIRVLKSSIKTNRGKWNRNNMQRVSSFDMVHNKKINKLLLPTNERIDIRSNRTDRRDTELQSKRSEDNKINRSRRLDVLEALAKVNLILQEITDKSSTKQVSTLESRQKKERAIENFYHGDGSDDWREQLSSIPKTDTQSRVEMLKNKLNRK